MVQPLSGGGDVRLESVVQWGKQGSGDQPLVVVSDFTALPPSTIDKLCFSRNIFNRLFYNLTIYLQMSWQIAHRKLWQPIINFSWFNFFIECNVISYLKSSYEKMLSLLKDDIQAMM